MTFIAKWTIKYLLYFYQLTDREKFANSRKFQANKVLNNSVLQICTNTLFIFAFLSTVESLLYIF